MKRTLIATTVLFSVLGAGVAFAADKCQVPAAEWQPTEALQQKLEGEGWKVQQIKTDKGCYEVYATDAKGGKVEAYFDPKTLEAVASDAASE